VLKDELLKRVHKLAAVSESDDVSADSSHSNANATEGRESNSPRGVNRPFLSDAGRGARELLLEYMRDAGMHASVDGAGNVIGTLECVRPSGLAQNLGGTGSGQSHKLVNHGHNVTAGIIVDKMERSMVYESDVAQRKIVVLGSHHDTVVNGGMWDGAYGVLASIAVAKVVALKSARGVCSLPFDIHVIAFDDEEGNNPFGTTNLGAKAYAGKLADFESDVAPEGAQLDAFLLAYARQFRLLSKHDVWEALRRAAVPSPSSRLLAFLELHIEQGPVLEDRGEPVGVVGAIAGQTRMTLDFMGDSGHAGTVPMRLRRDALVAAAGCVSEVNAVGNKFKDRDVVATVGTLNVAQASTNVIPGWVTMSLDVRSPQDPFRRSAVLEIQARCRAVSKANGVSVRFVVNHEVDSVAMAPWLRDIAGVSVVNVSRMHTQDAGSKPPVPDDDMPVESCRGSDVEACVADDCESRRSRITASMANDGIETEGHRVELEPHIAMTSGAGHDAQYMAQITSTAMLFVRCKDGISHSPLEDVDPEDAYLGALSLLRTVEELAKHEKYVRSPQTSLA
jgi:allantoate deiminase